MRGEKNATDISFYDTSLDARPVSSGKILSSIKFVWKVIELLVESLIHFNKFTIKRADAPVRVLTTCAELNQEKVLRDHIW